jgi:hypothetical protein
MLTEQCLQCSSYELTIGDRGAQPAECGTSREARSPIIVFSVLMWHEPRANYLAIVLQSRERGLHTAILQVHVSAG